MEALRDKIRSIKEKRRSRLYKIKGYVYAPYIVMQNIDIIKSDTTPNYIGYRCKKVGKV